MAQTDGSIVQQAGDPDAPPTLPVGFVIGGKYRVLRVLGAGGNGAVYEGEHTEVGHRVAIKVAHHKLDDRGDVMERFRREARISGSLRHPHIGQVFDVGTTDSGAPYMVMELQEGRSLSDVIDETQLPFAAIIDITRQLLAGLHAAHQAGTVHLDVKPDNVMLVRDHGGEVVVKLVDFGISRRLNESGIQGASVSSDGFVVGSPDYMPPEQLRGEAVDVRTDLYAAGVLLYEAIAHRPPFDGSTTEELVDNVLEGPVAPLIELRPDCPPELERVVLKAISRDPHDRYQSAEDMSRALASLRITAQRAVPVQTLEKPKITRPTARTDTSIRRRRTIDQRTLQTVRLGARVSVVKPIKDKQPPNMALIVGGAVLAVALVLGTMLAMRGRSSGVTVSAATPTGTSPQVASVTNAPPTAAAAPSAAEAAPAPPAEPAPAPEAIAAPTPAEPEPPAQPVPEEPAAEQAAAEQAVAEPETATKPSTASARTSRARAAQRAPEKQAAARKPEPPKAPPPPPKPEQDPALTKAQLKEAAALFKRGQNAQALAIYRQIVKVAPSNADAWRGLAVTANRQAERSEAERALRRYLQLRPGAKDAATILQRVSR